ncbi:DDB1-and CUL4-associated factor 12 [Fasciola gigantica]|uniref:DDB1-and CUL4-associated factor 12 n=1 Tax=Fasciola gigantica TaxID=46835 RepID=A0A504Z3E8_FASGI|nr:DDB1-and CUL4-associated factor 12 [Fasciola gigantica]
MTERVKERRLRGTKSVLKLLRSRELGNHAKLSSCDIPLASAKLPQVWNKRPVNPGFRNKIFASQWVTTNYIVYGTKCNQLVLYDTKTNEALEIPLIRSEASRSGCSSSTACGIHSIQKNTSETLLATGGQNVNEVGIYKLSELSPYCLLKDCHKDWVFDLRWIDDSYLASCSRDSSLALWRIPTYHSDNFRWNPTSSIHVLKSPSGSVPTITNPVAHVVSAIPDDRFRAVEHVVPFNLLAVVSMSRRLYMYDAVRIGSDSKARPVFTLALRDAYQEAVALRSWPNDPRCVALATHHCVILFDIRCSNPINAMGRCIHPPLSVSGVRSLNFHGDILSYGSSNGQVRFYDLKANKHLPVHLDVGPGWVKPFDCGANGDDSIGNNNNSSESLPPASGDNWPPQNPSVYPSWNTPPPSPLQSFFLAPPSSVSYPLFTRTGGFVSQVNNLRVSLDRIRNRLAGLRGLARANASLMYSVAGLRVPNTNEVGNEFSSSTSDGVSNTSSHSQMLSGADENRTEEMEEADERDSGPFDDSGPTSQELPTPNSSRPRWRIQFDSVDDRDFISIPQVLFADFDPNSTLSAHRRLTAVYTHEYDPSGTRLFTAGGPIASTCHGNVAALWE